MEKNKLGNNGIVDWLKDKWAHNPMFSTLLALLVMVLIQSVVMTNLAGSIGGMFGKMGMAWLNILRNNTYAGIIALGMCFIIISGGIDLSVQGGDVVVATGSVRQEGTSREYMPLEYPAVPDFDVTLALRDGIRAAGLKVHTGVVQAKDSFYGQHRPSVMPIAPKLEYQWDAWKRGGVLCSEMESAALFTVCNYLRVRSGAAFHVIWNQERRDAGIDDVHAPDMEPTLKAVIEGLKLLIQRCQRTVGQAAFHIEFCIKAQRRHHRQQEPQGRAAFTAVQQRVCRRFFDGCDRQNAFAAIDLCTERLEASRGRGDILRQRHALDHRRAIAERRANQQAVRLRLGGGDAYRAAKLRGGEGHVHCTPPAVSQFRSSDAPIFTNRVSPIA